MIENIDTNDPAVKELVERIVIRMTEQSEPEILFILSKLFPNSPTLRIKSVAEDLANKRINIDNEFANLLSSDKVNTEIFNILSSADADPAMIFSRSQYDPTKFELTLTCKRTPFKELFDECKDITCESCITKRILKFETKNEHSKEPWELKIERVEQRRLDLCKNCGKMLGKSDDINMQNERLLYKCSYCGHRGWSKAK